MNIVNLADIRQERTADRKSTPFAFVARVAACIVAFTALAGCASSPTNFMQTAANEAALSGTVPPEQTVTAIQPVQSSELPAPGDVNASVATFDPNSIPNPAPEQTGNDAYMAETGSQIQNVLSGSENEIALAGTTQPAMLQPIQPGPITGEQTSAPIMLANTNPKAPLPAVNNTPATPGVFEDTRPRLASLSTSYAPSAVDLNNSFALGSESSPIIDPLEAAAQQRIPALYARVEHGQCNTGRGPAPKKISAKRINPGDPYYIEIRMRRTPLLPVGHTYVAYGRLDPNGKIIDEKLIMLAPVGGYAGAALASGIPMPGILNPHPDDCRIRPETAYRISLDAQKYEKLLLEVEKVRAETPSYLLFAYNCNHFMTRMAGVVGIRPPQNIYVPALEYIYAMIEENEGRKIARF